MSVLGLVVSLVLGLVVSLVLGLVVSLVLGLVVSLVSAIAIRFQGYQKMKFGKLQPKSEHWKLQKICKP